MYVFPWFIHGFILTNTQIDQNLDTEQKKYITNIHESFFFENHFFIVLDLCGPSMLNLLEQRGFAGFPLPEIQRLLKGLMRALSGLASLNIIHCDVKPENILNGMNENQDVKLIDFGTCFFSGECYPNYVQSRYYRSPEVFLKLPFGTKADAWSLGCVAAELMLGLPLFPALNEVHLIYLVNDMMGVFPKGMYEKSIYGLDYIDKNGNSILCEDLKMVLMEWKPYFVQKTLSSIIMSYSFDPSLTEEEMEKERENREIFISFLKSLLEIDPNNRSSVADAMQHQFMKINFK